MIKSPNAKKAEIVKLIYSIEKDKSLAHYDQ